MPQKIELTDFSGGVTDYHLYAPANKLKKCDNLLINHYQDMGKPFNRYGSELYDKDYPQPLASRINACFKYKGLLFVIAAGRLFYYDAAFATRWREVKNPDNENPFPADNTIYYSYSVWNNHILITGSASNGNAAAFVQKIIINNNTPEIRNAGMFPLDKIDVNTIGPSSTSGANTYLYKFVYKQSYNAGNALYEDYGTPTLSKKVSSAAINPSNPLTLSNLPSLPPFGNGFKVADFKLEIYRTVNNGTIFYYVGEVPNGTTSFVDDLPDVLPNVNIFLNQSLFPTVGNQNELYFSQNNSKYFRFTSPSGPYVEVKTDEFAADLNKTLYTTGGVVENATPSPSRCLHIKNDTAYYGNTLDLNSRPGSPSYNRFRIYQSVVGDIDSVPEDFYVDLDDEVVCISSTKSNVVILCRNSVYRLDGAFDELGRGGMVVERISDTAGCISIQCAVQALDGVFWLGQDGAYFTDGFRVIKLNEDYDKTYKTFVYPEEVQLGSTVNSRVQKIQGKYDKKKKRVWWTVQEGDATEVNKCYVLDLNWGIKENATFTTVSGNSFCPASIEFDEGDMIRCDKNGYILIHRAGLYTDPEINPDVPFSQWNKETIIYSLETISFDFGTSATRKFVTQLNVTCESETNLSLQIISNNDDDKRIANLLPIRSRSQVIWGEPDVYWLDKSLEWNKKGLIHEKRLFPAKSLRCNYKSIALTNAKVAILSSDVIGNANVNRDLKQVTLLDITDTGWPTTSVNYFIAFENDNYQNEYKITAWSDTILTYQDSLNTSQSATNIKWVIRGYPKGEILNLVNMSAVYEVSGPTLHPYRTADSGEVGT